VSNLVPSCIPGTQDSKKALSFEEFPRSQSPCRHPRLAAPLKDAAAINATRRGFVPATDRIADRGPADAPVPGLQS
jgi:hypothetical protein